MRIKVKQKKGTYTSTIPVFIVTLVFFLFGVGLGLLPLIDIIDGFTFDYFIAAFSEGGIAILFGLSFFAISLLLIFFIIKGPKKYAAVLKNIDVTEEKGITKYNYKFELIGDNDSVYDKYECYTDKDYNLEIGKTYGLRIKQMNWRVRRIEEYVGKVDTIKKEKKKNDLEGINVVFYMFFFIFGGGILFLIIKIFYDFANGNNEFLPNIIGIISCSLFFGPALYFYMMEKYESKSIEEKIEYEANKISRKLDRVDRTKNIVSNIQYNGASDIDLSNINSFIVNRAPFNDQDNYEVIDDHYDRKLYKVINENEKYYLKDSIDCIVAEIKIDKNDNGVEILFVPIKEESFALCHKRTKGFGFKVFGKDYNIQDNKKIITISDGNGINIGTMQLDENFTFPTGKVEINNTVNNLEIIMLCVGVVMIEYHYNINCKKMSS